MDNEIKIINKRETWEIVDKPNNKEIIDTKWVYTKKRNNTFKLE